MLACSASAAATGATDHAVVGAIGVQMSDWESRQREAVNLLNTIVRSSSFSDAVEVQPLLIAFSQIMAANGPDKHLELQPLHAYLKDNCKGVKPREIDNALIFLEFRLAGIGVTSVLPTHLQLFNQEQKEAVLAEWQGGNASTFEREKVPAPGAPVDKPAGGSDFVPKKKKGKGGSQAALLGVLVVVIIGAVAATLLTEDDGGAPVSKKLEVKNVDGGFNCVELFGAGTNLMCRVDPKELAKLDNADRELRAETMLDSFKAQGYRVVRVVNHETNKIVFHHRLK